jgi:hypothetical protein
VRHDRRMVAASADDYAWFTEQCAELADAYFITLVRGRTPDEVKERPGATTVGDWTLIVEPGAPREPGDPTLRELSRGTVLVAHGDSETTDPCFVWIRDGEVLLDFDPSSPAARRGSHPDGLVETLEQLGFDLAAEGPDEEWSGDARYRERALALGEQLTGVRLTLDDLRPQPAEPAAIPAPRTAPSAAPRRWSRADSWDEEYEIDDEDEFREDDEPDGDQEERDWPRLVVASARRLGRIFR